MPSCALIDMQRVKHTYFHYILTLCIQQLYVLVTAFKQLIYVKKNIDFGYMFYAYVYVQKCVYERVSQLI